MYITPKIEKILSEFNYYSWINKPLTKGDKLLLSKELNIPSYNDEPCKQTTLKSYLEELNFKIIDTKRLINGTQIRVSIIVDLEMVTQKHVTFPTYLLYSLVLKFRKY